MGYRQRRKGKSRMLAWLMIGIMAIGGVNVPAKNVKAASVTAVEPTSGDGSSTNPYQITSEANLIWLKSKVSGNNSEAANAILMNDITITSSNWVRIGNDVENKRYNDTFDGRGYTISNLTYQGATGNDVTSNVYGGLFGSISAGAVVKNVTIEGATFTGGYAAATVVAYNYGTIDHCYVKNSSISTQSYAGGICAQNMSTGVIQYCQVSGNGKAVATGTQGATSGGIAGNNAGKIVYCSNEIETSASTYCGGVVGYNSGSVTSAYSVGEIGNGTEGLGGVAGYNTGTIQKAYCDSSHASKAVGVDNYTGTAADAHCVSLSDFKSGKAAYLLNGSTSGTDVVWRQNVDVGTTDNYPVLDSTHHIVYQISDGVYSNTNDDSCAAGHSMTAYPAKAATCMAEGNVAYWVCNKCHRYFLDSTGTKSTTAAQVVLAKNNNHNLETHAATKATCITAGNSLYYQCTLCGKYYKDNAATQETTLQSVTIAALGHDYTVTFKWGSDNASAKATIICSRNDINTRVNCTITSTSTETTCTKAGTTTYTATATYDGKEFKDQKTVTGEKGSHVYGTPVFAWTKQADGSYTATAAYTCSVCSNKETVNCTMTQLSKTDATCTAKGSVTYRATVSGKSDYEDKAFEIDATGHQLTAVNAVAATCDTPGHIAYNECGICKKKFDSSKNLLTDAEVVIKATGHTYACKAGTDGTTHSQVCSKCGHTTGKEEHAGGTATCHSKKVCTKCGASYGNLLPHTYDATPVFTWTKTTNGYTVTARLACTATGCTNVLEDKNCTVTQVDTKQPTCTEAGDRYYTATAVLNNRSYSEGRQATGEIAAIGHKLNYVAAKAVGQCEGDGNKQYWQCETCGKCYTDEKAVNETTIEQMTIKAPGHDQSEITDNGDGTHSGTCSRCGKQFTKESHRGGTATCTSKAKCEVCKAGYGSVDVNNHNYGEPEYQWSKDGDTYSVKVVLTCERCDAGVENHQKSYDSVSGEVTSTILTEATCDKEGTILYNFAKTVDGRKYTAEKQDTIAKLSHQMKKIAAKEATCTEEGNIEYYQCERCAKVFRDAAGTTAVTLAQTVLPATGHNKNEVKDNGNGTHSGSCSKCGKQFTEEAHRGGTATCVKKAQCEVCGAEYGEYGEHDYIAPVFVWNKTEDGYAVNATITCKTCTEDVNGHTIQKECTVADPKVIDATSTAEGSITYTAKVIWMGTEYSDVHTDVIPKKEETKNPDEGKKDDDKQPQGDNPKDDKKDDVQLPVNNQPTNVTIINNNNTNNNTNIYVNMQVVDQSTHITYRVVTASDGMQAVSYGAAPTKDATKVTVPSEATINGATYKVVAIEKNAFEKNKKLKSVTIGVNVEEIGESAFGKCTNLKKVIIPSNVKKIGKGAFSGCKKLKQITIKTDSLTKQSIGAKAFKGISAKATIKVPKKVKKDYKKILGKKGIGSKVKIK